MTDKVDVETDEGLRTMGPRDLRRELRDNRKSLAYYTEERADAVEQKGMAEGVIKGLLKERASLLLASRRLESRRRRARKGG